MRFPSCFIIVIGLLLIGNPCFESSQCFPLYDVPSVCDANNKALCEIYHDYCTAVTPPLPGRCASLAKEDSSFCLNLGKDHCGEHPQKCKYRDEVSCRQKQPYPRKFPTYTVKVCTEIGNGRDCNSKKGPQNKKLCFWFLDEGFVKQQKQKKKLIAKLPPHPKVQHAYITDFVARYEAVIEYNLLSDRFKYVELKKHLKLSLRDLLTTLHTDSKQSSPRFSGKDRRLAVTGYDDDGDEREKVSDNSYLQRVGQLYAYDDNDLAHGCTATFISKYILLTAGHCVVDYDKDKIGKGLYIGSGMFYRNMFFYPGINGDDFGHHDRYIVRSVYVPSGYALTAPWKIKGFNIENHLSIVHELTQRYSWDWALVELDTIPDPHPGWMSFGYVNNKNILKDFNFESAGYPGDLDNTNGASFLYKTPFKMDQVGRLLSIDKKHIGYQGQSGSSIWHFDVRGGYNIIYGILSMKYTVDEADTHHMMATRINSVRYNIFKKIIEIRTNKRDAV